MNNKLLISIVVVLVIVAGAWWFLKTPAMAPSESISPSVSATASPVPSPTPTTTVSPAITITSPVANALVDSPIVVTGRARVFENQLTVDVKTADGQLVYATHVFTDAKDAGQYGNYKAQISIPGGVPKNLKVEAFALSAKGDGSYEGYASVPVQLKTTDTSTVYVGFVKASTTDCTTTTLYARSVIKSPQYVMLSILELLKGPLGAEKNQGAVDQIPPDTQLNSFKLTGDTAYVDFNYVLGAGVAGSCRVQAIRAEITNTLKQFLGLNNVVISINGKTEGILQP